MADDEHVSTLVVALSRRILVPRAVRVPDRLHDAVNARRHLLRALAALAPVNPNVPAALTAGQSLCLAGRDGLTYVKTFVVPVRPFAHALVDRKRRLGVKRREEQLERLLRACARADMNRNDEGRVDKFCYTAVSEMHSTSGYSVHGLPEPATFSPRRRIISSPLDVSGRSVVPV